jgi:ribosomal protein S18 acetylase RimI-like enzyme
MQNQLNVRPLQAADKTRWLDLWNGYLDFYEVGLAPEITENVWERIFDTNNPLLCLVAIQDEIVIGFTHYFFHGTTWHATSYCYLEDLYVDQNVRSRGAGRALIQAVKEAAQKEGASKLYWHTNKENETAQALYNKVAELTGFIRYDVML